MSEQQNVVFGVTRKSLEGVLIHACPHCEAPGVYKSDARTREHWPGCWRADALNQPVGAFCPNCGKRRRRDKDLGELTSSMPRWLWRCILGVKWCVVKLATFKHRRYGHAKG